MGEHITPAYKHMIRISVAEGMKRMYKEYRLKKWLKITEMAATVRRVLAAEMGPPEVLMGQQGQLIPANQQLPQQSYQYPNVQNMQLVQPALSPIPGPLMPMISPINTPVQTPDTIIRRHVTGTTPDEFHQFTITNVSANEEHLSGRQLFQDDNVDVSVQYNNMECDEIIVISDGEHSAESVPNSALSVANVHSLTGPSINFQHVGESVNNENIYNQSEYPMIPQQQHYQQQQNINELPHDNDEMEWEEDDEDDNNDSMDSLAGVLFATEHLLPDEQAVRLDVEMGDMGIGHMVFDRVSATWYIQHCEYYRAS